MLSYGVSPESLSDLGLIRYRVVSPQTDRRTERIAIANTRSAVPAGTAVARKNRLQKYCANVQNVVTCEIT